MELIELKKFLNNWNKRRPLKEQGRKSRKTRRKYARGKGESDTLLHVTRKKYRNKEEAGVVYAPWSSVQRWSWFLSCNFPAENNQHWPSLLWFGCNLVQFSIFHPPLAFSQTSFLHHTNISFDLYLCLTFALTLLAAESQNSVHCQYVLYVALANTSSITAFPSLSIPPALSFSSASKSHCRASPLIPLLHLCLFIWLTTCTRAKAIKKDLSSLTFWTPFTFPWASFGFLC